MTGREMMDAEDLRTWLLGDDHRLQAARNWMVADRRIMTCEKNAEFFSDNDLKAYEYALLRSVASRLDEIKSMLLCPSLNGGQR